MDKPYNKIRNDVDLGRPFLKIGRDETRGIETVSQAKRKDYEYTKELTKLEAKERRLELLSKFEKVESLFEHYGHSTAKWSWINQGDDGACTVASFLNLLHLTKREKLTGKSWAGIKAKKYWQNMYYAMNDYINDQYTYNLPELRDYADMLDIGLVLGRKLHKNIQMDQDFVYFPVAGFSQNENNKNRLMLEDEEAAKKRYKDFGERRVLHLIGHHIESRIDRNIPVGLSFNGHARVVVAYNDTHLLFMDSWVPNEDQFVRNRRGDGYMDYYIDGFSTMEKYMVYKDCRDLIYFEEAATKPAKKKAAKPAKKKVPAKKKAPTKPKRKPRGIRVRGKANVWIDKESVWKEALVVKRDLETVGEMNFPMYSVRLDNINCVVSIDELRIANEETRLNAYIYDIYKDMQLFSDLIRNTMKQREKQINAVMEINEVMKSGWFSNVDSMIDAMVCVESNGSGCMIETAQGPMVLTCAHCNMTERESQMENEKFESMVEKHGSYKEYNKFAVGRLKGIAWSDGSWGVAETVYNSEGMDIALMKIVTSTKQDIKTFKVSKAPPPIGEALLMIHNPYRLNPDKDYILVDENFPFRVDYDEIIEKQVNICVNNTFGAYTHQNQNSFYGSSGAPMVNAAGEVVAIHNSTDPTNDEWTMYAVGLESIQQALSEYVDGAPTRVCEELSYKLKF